MGTSWIQRAPRHTKYKFLLRVECPEVLLFLRAAAANAHHSITVNGTCKNSERHRNCTGRPASRSSLHFTNRAQILLCQTLHGRNSDGSNIDTFYTKTYRILVVVDIPSNDTGVV